MILACLKTFVEKRILENGMQNRVWNSGLDFIANEIWRLNLPELNPMEYYVWENIRGQSRAPPKTKGIAELKEMLQMTVLLMVR